MTIHTVCLLSKFEECPRWFACAIAQMVTETDVDVTQVYVQDSSTVDTSPSSFWRRLGKAVLPSTARQFGRWVLNPRVTPLFDRHVEWVPLRELSCLSTASFSTYEPTFEDERTVIPTDVVQRIADEADVVVQNYHGILAGDILTAPEYGVLSFHHGDVTEYRGVPPGFWEFLNDEREAGITLQRLSDTLDGGECIVTTDADISGASSWSDVRARQEQASIPMLAEGIRRLNRTEFEPWQPDELGPVYTFDDVTGWRIKLRYLAVELRRSFERRV